MPVVVSPLFWEWFNIWLIQFLKNLYHEIKMVALRGGNSSLGAVSHGCGLHGGQQNALDLTHRLQTSLGMQQSAATQPVGHHGSHLGHGNHSSHISHGTASQVNLPTLSSVSLLMPQQSPATLKHEQNTRYSNSNCMLPSHHYRLLTQARAECYHPAPGAGSSYMAGAGGSQSSAPTMRGQSAAQPSAPPAPQQDMSKTTMAGPSYVTPQNQTQGSRPQYPNFSQYRAPQHGNRPTTHPRQQQPYMGGAGASATGPVMYHPTVVFQPSPMGIPQTYQQPRSNSSGYYQYMPYISYTTPTGPPLFDIADYYPSNGQQLSASSVGGAGGRASAGTLVQPPAAQPAPGPLAHAQAAPHIHPGMSGTYHNTENISGIRPSPPKRTSRRLPIINPLTKQDIFSELYSNDSQYLSTDSSEGQTSQTEPTHSFAEEFGRMVNEAVNQPSPTESCSTNFVSKAVEAPVTTASPNQPHTNAITTINSNTVKSEILNVNENKSVVNEIIEFNETPVVSAISDSPVVVPKVSMNVKQLQKSSEQSQPLAVDNKNLPTNKQQKQSKSKPVVPQDELEKQSETVTPIVPQNTINVQAEESAPVSVSILAPVSVSMSTSSTASSATSTVASVTLIPSSLQTPAPQPQRIREPRERVRSEDKDKPVLKPEDQKTETPKLNGPTSVEISSVDSLVTINASTSQVNQDIELELANEVKQLHAEPETEIVTADKSPEIVISRENTFPANPVPTATELLSASIEKLAKEQPIKDSEDQLKAESTAIQAQVKLTQGIASVARNQPDPPMMKDINLNTDPDAENGNPTEVTNVDTVKDEGNKNEKSIKNTKNNNKKSNKLANNELQANPESYENGKDETDKVSKEEKEVTTKEEEQPAPSDIPVFKVPAVPPPASTPAVAQPSPPTPPAVVAPKYKYSDDQWSPFNKSGRKCYNIGFLMQVKDDPVTKNKPNIPMLDACNVTRTTPILETHMTFNTISRPVIDALLPNYAKNSGIGSRSNTARDPKKDGRSMQQSGKGSMKLSASPSGSSAHRQYISISLSREEVKLNQAKDAWKPTRFKKDNLTEEEYKTQDLYKKFRGILNKLTPQKFDALLDKVKGLEINTQARLEGVIDLVFEKAIDEPNFSEAYAAMCSKLSMLKVPSDNSPDQFVNFRGLIISKCQNQFITNKMDENVLKLEKELAECTDPAKKKELHDQLTEENRRIRMRSVGNVRFIGELYKLKMLTAKIMMFCMNYLIDKLEEEKLECLCKLLTTIGEQVENEVKDQLEIVFKRMQDIVDRKSSKISNRVRFMIQDVMDLRRGRWVTKNVVDSQPKMMDQIQKEAEQHQRNIELMNSNPMGGGFRREDGRGKRGGEGRRQGSNSFMDNQWKSPRTSYTVDTSKLKAVTQKNLNNIKLAPPSSAWNHGSGAKNPVQASSNSMISLSKNMYSMLETTPGDPTSLNTNKDMSPSYQHSKSIERSTFNSRGDYNNENSSRSGSIGVPRSNSGSRSSNAASKQAPEASPSTPVAQEPLPPSKQKAVKMHILEMLVNPSDEEFATDFKQTFPVQYHAAAVTEMLNIALEKSAKDVHVIAKAMHHLISTGIISGEHFLTGMTEILECAPDLYIDIPMLYEYLGKFFAPQIEKKHISFIQTFRLCDNIIMSNHGHMFLKTVIRDLKESMGPTFVKTKWQESGLALSQWMSEEQVPKWIEDNKFEFLEGGNASEETKKILTPSETQSKLLQLLNTDENCDCIRGWVQDNLGASSKENWFIRALIQAICEHALFGAEGRDVPHFSHERMNKFAPLISEFGESREQREASCLFGIQQLIYRLQHPPGLALEIFQFLHEQYIISVEGFTAWEVSEMEPEGKGVMLKALTSFFTNIKEADNEESCSED
ncbi:eukaryotic translation initiation factor 4 gamma 3-like isoform X4 [Maniola jurtina]|uniref:eukaryotic translation initiation factor 4 gamma 3-like isoform X4 n=1 Tax=Maniola jurtina TaxID=191418 RepID=UPI001E68E4B1|nr:eukaryotic translation initiation factor 4 gamma 3-like isoform X4 [Maniola jurtina]